MEEIKPKASLINEDIFFCFIRIRREWNGDPAHVGMVG